ncbi:MAG: TVP38/TMEM64 family protein [bacterium]|nr:TVP38/TMEM64 family protein [bacterium]
MEKLPRDERPPASTNSESNESSLPAWWRSLAVVAFLVGFSLLVEQAGWIDQVTPESVRESVRAAGPWGAGLYIVLFSLGELDHIPGIMFVAAGILAYGKLFGFALGLLGAIVSVSFSFIVVRTLGGQHAVNIRSKSLRRVMTHLDRRPIRTVFILRSLLFISPALNYALALTKLPFRDYLIGSALGLTSPVLAMALLFEQIFS